MEGWMKALGRVSRWHVAAIPHAGGARGWAGAWQKGLCFPRSNILYLVRLRQGDCVCVTTL